MAERPEHLRMLRALGLLNAEFLRSCECWFGGGTAVALRCDGFRLSHDLDFLCSSTSGYRRLREAVHDKGALALVSEEAHLCRELRADRYGVRFVIEFEGQPLKVELVREGRISLSGQEDETLPVARLTDDDLVSEKLLANEDRFRDSAALGRDVIDLIVLEKKFNKLSAAAKEKARTAYGDCVDDAYREALQRLRDDPSGYERAAALLSLDTRSRAVIGAKLASLK